MSDSFYANEAFSIGEERHGENVVEGPIEVEDMDECLIYESNICHHRCVNTAGSFRCECFPGYVLQEDAFSCAQGKTLWGASRHFQWSTWAGEVSVRSNVIDSQQRQHDVICLRARSVLFSRSLASLVIAIQILCYHPFPGLTALLGKSRLAGWQKALQSLMKTTPVGKTRTNWKQEVRSHVQLWEVFTDNVEWLDFSVPDLINNTLANTNLSQQDAKLQTGMDLASKGKCLSVGNAFSCRTFAALTYFPMAASIVSSNEKAEIGVSL